MGMFNYIMVDCPECGEREAGEFQTKSGTCLLMRFHISHVPEGEVDGIKGRSTTCTNCGHKITIENEKAIKKDFSHIVK